MRHEKSERDKKWLHQHIRLIAWFISRTILIIAFFGIILPIGFIVRFVGSDPLQRRLNSSATTYYRPSKERVRDHMDKLF